MTKSDNEYKKGDVIEHGTYGTGTVLSREYVEIPSDDDHNMYRVEMEDGQVRHFKASEISIA